MQLQDGDFVKGLVSDLLGQLRATNINLPQAFIQFGMQGVSTGAYLQQLANEEVVQSYLPKGDTSSQGFTGC